MPRILIYQQNPQSYENVHEMTTDLERIRLLNFTHIYINPIHLCSKTLSVQGKIGSVYAIRLYSISSDTFAKTIRSAFLADEDNKLEALIQYTKKAKALGLLPLFDLVLKHVAHDYDFEANSPLNRDWFEDAPREEMDDVINFKYALTEEGNISDQAFIDNVWSEILENFWKPYITFYMKTLGFTGARVDAIRYLPPKIQFDIYNLIRELTPEQQSPVIFSELLFGERNNRERMLESMIKHRCHPTHITNSLYWCNFSSYGIKARKWLGRENDTLIILSTLCQATSDGGTVGFAGFHDGDPLLAVSLRYMATSLLIDKKQFPNNSPQYKKKRQNVEVALKEFLQTHEISNTLLDLISHNDDLTQNLLQLIDSTIRLCLSAIAFSSNGGLLFQCGDEFCSLSKRSVFIGRYQECMMDWQENYFHQLTEFIRCLNEQLVGLPSGGNYFWVDHFFILGNDGILVTLLHYGKGYDGENYIALTNLMNEPFDFTEHHLKEINETLFKRELSQWNQEAAEKAVAKMSTATIITCGNINNQLNSCVSTYS